MMKPTFTLIDMPVYPKGLVSYSLLAVAKCLEPYFRTQIVDLNITDQPTALNRLAQTDVVGLKVSAQNYSIACQFTRNIKTMYPGKTVVWGGELPSLLPQEALTHADVIVEGLFEPVADTFAADWRGGTLKRHYVGKNTSIFEQLPCANFSLLNEPGRYYTFMGFPLETSRGCTEKCAFCMVHVMQKKNYFLKSYDRLRQILPVYEGKFINIIDYNFGVSKEHVMAVSALIEKSGALGWMAEMCIELLDDDEMLAAMARSGCKMIYCGLESIDESALQSVHKMNTNRIENYARIIRKVQSYGIQVAAGFILGIANTCEETFRKTIDFFQQSGIIYVKLTFLTYNPGTKVHKYMQKKGTYVANTIDEYDGMHLSYLPLGVEKQTVLNGAVFFIKKFYSLRAIIRRSAVVQNGWLARLEYILFAFCYAEVYRQWLKTGFLQRQESFELLLNTTFEKPVYMYLAEKTLQWCRKRQKRKTK